MNGVICSGMKKVVSIQQKSEAILEIDSFRVSAGEQLAIMGPSGSGKTTFLKLISGLETPSSGEISVFDQALSKLTEFERDRFRGINFGIVLQEFQLFPYLTSIENIIVQRLAYPKYTRKDAKKRGIQLLQKLGLAHRIDHRISLLSKGEQQRVAIARALFHHPKLLLVDEPTSSLDARTGMEVMMLLKKMCKEYNCTLITVTHDQRVANLFPRIEYMDKLNVVYRNVIKEVLT